MTRVDAPLTASGPNPDARDQLAERIAADTAINYYPAITRRVIVRDHTSHAPSGWADTCPICGAGPNPSIFDFEGFPVRLTGTDWISNCCRVRGDRRDLLWWRSPEGRAWSR